jgi:hypothetical protein
LTKIICNQCGKEITSQQRANKECYNLTIPLYEEDKIINIDFHRACLDKALFNMMKEFKVMPEKEDIPLCDCPDCRAERGEFDDD